MHICINKALLGSKKHLSISDSDFSWSIDAPSVQKGFTYGFLHHPRSIEPLLELHNLCISDMSTKEEMNTFKACSYFEPPPWPLVLGKKEFLSRVCIICDELKAAVKALESDKYTSVFMEGVETLGMLTDARIDKEELKLQVASTENATLRSYSQKLSGSLSIAPIYNRVKTKTGRLTIKSGPPILTLPKSSRAIYRSSFANGEIIEIDFTSLEPRCASNLAGNDFTDHDLYSYLQNQLSINATRDKVKELVISLLYGAGDNRARRIIQSGSTLDVKKGTAAFQAVKDFFSLDEMKKKLLQEAKSGKILNFFGRPIAVDNLQPGVLVNNYIQSTAVDISLLGFGELIKRLDTKKAKPLFIIHDAIIIDTAKEYVQEIKALVGDYYRHSDLGIFPWKIRSV